MSYLESHVEIITDGGRRRRWPASEKLRIVEESFDPGETVSSVARRTQPPKIDQDDLETAKDGLIVYGMTPKTPQIETRPPDRRKG